MVSVTASLLQYACLSVVSLLVCLALSSSPCYWQTKQAVPIKRAQGGLLWQQLLWCAAVLSVCLLSLCVCVCVYCCLLAVQGRQAQFTWSRLLLCPLLSLWESFPLERGWYSIVPQAATAAAAAAEYQLLSLFSPFLIHFSLLQMSLHISLVHSLLCLLNLLFFLLVFSEPFSPSTVSSALPSLSVCLHSSSIRTDLVGIHKWSSVELYRPASLGEQRANIKAFSSFSEQSLCDSCSFYEAVCPGCSAGCSFTERLGDRSWRESV